jgi:hypothetical protein
LASECAIPALTFLASKNLFGGGGSFDGLAGHITLHQLDMRTGHIDSGKWDKNLLTKSQVISNCSMGNLICSFFRYCTFRHKEKFKFSTSTYKF